MINNKRTAYTAVVGEDGFRLGIAVEGEQGYYACKDGTDAGGTFPSYEAAQAAAEAYNKRLGFTDEQAFEIVTSTMFGSNAKRRGK